MNTKKLLVLVGLGGYLLGFGIRNIIVNQQKNKAAKQILDYDLECKKLNLKQEEP